MLKDIKDISKDMALFYRPVFTPPFLLRAQVVIKWAKLLLNLYPFSDTFPLYRHEISF